jgi:hypothetical protein
VRGTCIYHSVYGFVTLAIEQFKIGEGFLAKTQKDNLKQI